MTFSPLFLFFAFFLLLVPSLTSAVDLNDELAGATGYFLDNSNVFRGFCLPLGVRKITNFSDPLYSRTLKVGMPFSSTFDHVLHWVHLILIREVIGYPVTIVDTQPVMSTWFTMLQQPPQSNQAIDFMTNSAYAGTKVDVMAQILNNMAKPGLFKSYGAYDAFDQGGFFFPTITNNPSRKTYQWTDFSGGVAVGPRTEGFAFPYSDSHWADVRAAVEVFRLPSWGYMQANPSILLNDPANPALGPVCPPDQYTLQYFGFRAGCNDLNFPSMFIPKQCYPNPVAQCAVAYTFSPALAGSFIQNILVSLNLSIAVAFINSNAMLAVPMALGMNGVLQVTATFASGPQNLCTDPVTGSRIKCLRRMVLPQYDSTCGSQYDGNWNSTYVCDSPPLLRYRFSRRDMPQIAPRVDTLLSKADFTLSDISEFYFNLLATGSDAKRAACNWLTARLSNPTSWLSWIAPPEPCSRKDYSFTTSDCDQSKNEYTISYYWNSPKSCVGGVPLPSAEKYSCGFYSLEHSSYASVVGVGAGFASLPFLYLIVFVIQLYFGVTTTNAALATRALALSKSLQSKSAPSPTAADGPKTSHSRSTSTVPEASPAAAPALDLMRLPSFCQVIVCLPVSHAFGPFLAMFELGLLCLLVVVWSGLNEPSDSRCWTRYSFLIIGLSLLNFSTASAIYKVRKAMQRTLSQNQNHRLAISSAFAMVAIVTLLIIASQGSSMAAFGTSQLSGGAVVSYPYCDAAPGWLNYVLLAINIFPAFYSLLMIIALFFRVQCDSVLSAIAQSRSQYSSLKGRNKVSKTRAQLTQVNTLFMVQIVSLVAAIVLLFFSQSTATESNQNAEALFNQGLFIIILLPVLNLLLFVPSLFYQRQQSNRLSGKLNNTSKSRLPDFFSRLKFKSAKTGPQSSVGSGTGTNMSRQRSSGPDREEVAVHVLDQIENRKNLRESSRIDSRTESQSMSDVEQEGTTELNTLSNVFSDPVACLLFEQFAESVFDAESIHFLMACKRFFHELKQPNLNLAQLLVSLERINQEYIMVNAPQQINISASLRSDVTAEVQRLHEKASALVSRYRAEANRSTANVVAPAELRASARSMLLSPIKEVYGLLGQNTFIRFLNSPQAMRANELIMWSETFFDMSAAEQEAMVKRLNQIIKQRSGNEEASHLSIQAQSMTAGAAEAVKAKERMVLDRAALRPRNSFGGADQAPGMLERSPSKGASSRFVPNPNETNEISGEVPNASPLARGRSSNGPDQPPMLDSNATRLGLNFMADNGHKRSLSAERQTVLTADTDPHVEGIENNRVSYISGNHSHTTADRQPEPRPPGTVEEP